MAEIAQAMGFGNETVARQRKTRCKDRLIEFVEKAPEFRELKNT